MNQGQPPALRRRPLSRRLFLRGIFLGATALFSAQMAGAFAIFFRPMKVGAFGQKLKVGKVEDFEVGSITHFQEGKLYLSRVPEGFLALWHKCTHLGCTVPWIPNERTEDDLAKTGRFNCPCHASIFNRYGEIKAGPAPRPLDLFPVSIVDGVVVVDTDPGKVILREKWDPKQAVKA